VMPVGYPDTRDPDSSWTRARPEAHWPFPNDSERTPGSNPDPGGRGRDEERMPSHPHRMAVYPRSLGHRRMASTENASADEDLMRQVAGGSPEALALLHRRFARLIFGLAAQTLDRATAEDLVQEVFLAVWPDASR